MSEPSISDLNLVTLKHGKSYALFDRNGDISPELGLMGIYVDDMRYTSALTLLLGNEKPQVAGSQVTNDNVEFITSLTNSAMKDRLGADIPQNSINLRRRIVVCDGLVHQAITIRNYNDRPVDLPLNFKFNSDFVDMFNVRGNNPKKALGTQERAKITQNPSRATWLYKGVDKLDRKASISFSSSPKPEKMTENRADFFISIPTNGEVTIYLEFGQSKDNAVGPGPKSYQDAVNAVRSERVELQTQGAKLEFTNPYLQEWFDRSLNDISFLTSKYDSGPYPCAGVPWFAVPFGRDGIITALETLWAKPEMAKGVLQFLSEKQAQKKNEFQDAEPGKIMHETRENEMSRAGMLPFGQYYGGVDSTLLYVILAGEYLRQTNDKAFIKKIWPNIQNALKWMEDYAEDKNWSSEKALGFMVYQRKLEAGLYNQMWKDSQDSVFYKDGDTNVKFPRAVCEVQGYAYAAWNTGKKLAGLFQEAASAKRYGEKAKALYKNFNEKFWDEKGNYYVLALDGDKKPCQVKASNMGQLLFTGIVPPDRAEKIVSMLMDEKFFTGFGIRTLAEGEARYNPLSYHNGSIWPHDTALIAAGMGKTGHTDDAAKLFTGLMATAKANNWRLPELFGGFKKEEGLGPTAYPRACSPQAWAAAAPFQLLQAVLGLEVDAKKHEVKIDPNHWQKEWGTLRIKRLPVGDKTADIEISSGELKIISAKGIKFISPDTKTAAKAARKKSPRQAHDK